MCGAPGCQNVTLGVQSLLKDALAHGLLRPSPIWILAAVAELGLCQQLVQVRRFELRWKLGVTVPYRARRMV